MNTKISLPYIKKKNKRDIRRRYLYPDLDKPEPKFRFQIPKGAGKKEEAQQYNFDFTR